MMSDKCLNDSHFVPFLNNWDCCGWVPNIRGKLSINFINSKNIWGDTDRYAIALKAYDKVKENELKKSNHYIVASSLFTLADSKKNDSTKRRYRTFRFIFQGSINDKKRIKEFVKSTFRKEEQEKTEKTIENEDILIGRLSIIAKLTYNLTKEEAELLKNLKELEVKKEAYDKNFFVDALEPETLEEDRGELKKGWEEAKIIIKSFEKTLEDEAKTLEDEANSLKEKAKTLKGDAKSVEEYANSLKGYAEKIKTKDRIYKFEVALSRDGILFLKDATIEIFKKDYFNKDDINNYEEHIPIPRIFKTATCFIKFLFHKNYHHNHDDDTFLPASNLHPIRNIDGQKLTDKTKRLNKHQFDAFLRPIIEVKRGKQSCNPSGVLLYAQSFLDILEKNKLIPDEEAKYERRFLKTQKEEVEEYLSEKKLRFNSFITQDNIQARITVGLAFVAAFIGIFKFLFVEENFPRLNNFCDINFNDIKETIRLWIIVGSFGLGFIFDFLVKKINRTRKFRPKKERRSILNRCSKIIEKKKEDKTTEVIAGRFSNWYILRILLIELKIFVGSYVTEIIKLIIVIVSGIAATKLYRFLEYCIALVKEGGSLF